MSDYSAVAPPQSQNFSQSSAFAAALQRAKQIAAKINPQGSQNNQDPTKKRPLEDGSEPESKKLASNIPDPVMNLRGTTSTASSIADSPISRPSGPTTPNLATYGGICNEEIRVPDNMVGLIIGRGGEQITRLQSETGCKIQMATESGGMSDRTCTITGTKDAVNRAKELVQSIVSNQRNKPDDQIPGANPPYPGPTGPAAAAILSGHPGYQEIMIPGPKVGLIIGKGGETIKQLQEKSGAKMVVIQDGPGQESEKPLRITGDPQKVEHAKQLVYELIAEKEMQMYNRGSRNSNFSGNSFNQDTGGDGAEVFVPKTAVGIVIGKGGEMVKKIQQETGAKLQFIPVDGQDAAHGDRKVIISGSNDCIETAKMRIQDLIDSAKRNQRNNFNSNRPNEYGGGGGGGGGWNNRDMGNKIEFSYAVPANKCGIVIGKGGETIKQINQQTGAHCELDRRNPGTETEKYFTIKGTPEQVEHAKRVFAEKLGGGMNPANNMYGQNQMGYSTGWNTAGYQAWPGQTDPNATQPASVQINPVTGQPDYSAQWAEYYRSMGRHMEADMIEQQAKQQQQQALAAKTDVSQPQGTNPPNPATVTPTPQQAAPQAQPQQQPQQQQSQQNGSGADYSAQWAEYYRSIGKVKEAEAIEAQMKSGKPSGGANPMGQQQPQQQQQMQPNPMANQAGAPGAAPNAFPQAYGGYPGMNPASGGYYTPQAQVPGQPGQQNPAFPPANYQNYQYPQPSSDN